MNTFASHHRLLILFTLLLASALPASASDTEKEKRWESQIVDTLISGEAVKLKAGTTEFLGLYTPAGGKKVYGGIILLHGIGAHPAWPEVIEPLREQLPEHGWAVLSLQMPILPNDATDKDYAPLFEEAPPRIQAGVDFLKGKGVKNIVFMGHSLGNSMASYYLTGKPDPAVHAVVVISGGLGVVNDPKADSTKNFAKVSLPFLDIYGSQDQEGVLQAVKQRGELLKKTNPHYEQVKIEGADHFYVQFEDQLVKRVRSWLTKKVAVK